MQNKVKNLCIGIGVTGINIAAASSKFIGAGACTGTCGSCGLSCLIPVIGVATVGTVVVAGKKLKEKKISYLRKTEKLDD